MNPRPDSELNRIIAEWCGWSFVPEHDVGFPTPAGIVYPEKWYAPKDQTGEVPPDYCTDLNAMHEAEEKLSKIQEEKYIVTLCLEVQPVPSLWNATARQRSEALVKVIEESNL